MVHMKCQTFGRAQSKGYLGDEVADGFGANQSKVGFAVAIEVA
jgi:hypothetical protein